MYSQNVNLQTSINGLQRAGNAPIPSETELESTIGVSLIADYNGQLSAISTTLQNQLSERVGIRQEIAGLQNLQISKEGEFKDQVFVDLTVDEAKSLNLPKNAITTKDAQGKIIGYTLDKESFKAAVTSTIESKQGRLSELNSTSELMALQVQSLVDQRKSALMLLTNLVASRNETLTGIIRNIRS